MNNKDLVIKKKKSYIIGTIMSLVYSIIFSFVFYFVINSMELMKESVNLSLFMLPIFFIIFESYIMAFIAFITDKK